MTGPGAGGREAAAGLETKGRRGASRIRLSPGGAGPDVGRRFLLRGRPLVFLLPHNIAHLLCLAIFLMSIVAHPFHLISIDGPNRVELTSRQLMYKIKLSEGV